MLNKLWQVISESMYTMEFKLFVAGIALYFLARLLHRWLAKSQGKPWGKLYKEVYEWIETGWSAVLLASFLMYFFVQAFAIPSGSMRVTLLEGDHLFVNKFIYGFHIPFSGGKRFWPAREVKRGDIIIFQCPPEALTLEERERGVRKDFIKRCVAVGGDVVQIKNKKVIVDGEELKESYVSFVDDAVYQGVNIYRSSEEYQRAWESGKFANFTPDMVRDNLGPVVVPPGYYFAMGDNRDRSFDSRFWGPVPDKLMKGRALVIYWPLSRIRVIK